MLEYRKRLRNNSKLNVSISKIKKEKKLTNISLKRQKAFEKLLVFRCMSRERDLLAWGAGVGRRGRGD